MARYVRRSTLVAGVVGFVLCWSLSGGYAIGASVQLTNVLSAEDAALCEAELDEEGHSVASARLVYQQGDGHTQVRILVDKARPHALFTVWVILADPSPLTGVEPTPMVPSDVVADLVPVTPPVGFPFGLQSPPFEAGDGDTGDGDTTEYMDSTGPTGPGFGTRSLVLNGFYTDGFGRGMFETHLDFELVGKEAAYPFDRVAIPGRVMQDQLKPVPIDANLPFAVVSHCKDEKGHGLVFRANNATGDQGWFLFFSDD